MLSNFAALKFYSALLLLSFFSAVSAARCKTCFDDPCNGAAHDTADCPWTTGVASNVSALLAAATTAVVVEHLLPTRLIRIFPRAVLSTLQSLAAKASGGDIFTPTTTTTAAQLVKEIACNRITREEAQAHITAQIEAVDESDDNAGFKFKKLEAMMSAVSRAHSRVAPNSSISGKFTYVSPSRAAPSRAAPSRVPRAALPLPEPPRAAFPEPRCLSGARGRVP